MIFINAGTYTFTTAPLSFGSNLAAIGTNVVPNVEFYGTGNRTILKAGTNLNVNVLGVVDAGGWYIHDLVIDANRAHQSGAGTTSELDGLFISNSDGTTVEHVYEHDENVRRIREWKPHQTPVRCFREQ